MTEEPDMQPIPRFVVVGRVNKGKSSLVATLAEAGSVAIDRIPGTTQNADTFEFKIGKQVLFELIDTPGFQEARRALAWMQKRAKNPGQRPEAVEAFVNHFRDDADQFTDEVRLLEPILEGTAGILYVVDGSQRYRTGDEAEMEILRWTGRPAMALINHVRDRRFDDQWQPILNQHFNLVRTFNAHRASFEDRIELLRGFRELRQEWKPAMDEAILLMEGDKTERMRRLGRTLAEHIWRSLSHTEKTKLPGGVDENQRQKLKANIKVRYEDKLRDFETESRKEVERIFRHTMKGTSDQNYQVPDPSDLFSEESMRAFGLTKFQLAVSATIGGGSDGGRGRYALWWCYGRRRDCGWGRCWRSGCLLGRRSSRTYFEH